MDQKTEEFAAFESAEQISESNLFNKIAHFRQGSALFELVETNYILAVSADNKMHWRITSGGMGLINKAIPFEDVFEEVPAHIQAGLAFHLDLFKE